MKVSSTVGQTDLYKSYEEQKLKQQEEIKSNYTDLKAKFQTGTTDFSAKSMGIQTTISNTINSTNDTSNAFSYNSSDFQKFLKDVGYTGKNIPDLSQDEAKKLVADDGFFGVNQTAQRIADFVIKGAGDDESMLRAGRAGIMQGFNDAQKAWGGKLPDISKQTIAKATDLINQKMSDLGYSVLDTNA